MIYPNMAAFLDDVSKAIGDDPAAWSEATRPEVVRLLRTLRSTGPLFHGGRVYLAGEGESYESGIAVIDDVRVASEVAYPGEV